MDFSCEGAEALIIEIEKQKRLHHQILLRIFSFLNLRDTLTIGRVNRKLYIVSGDVSLLSNFMKEESVVVRDPRRIPCTENT